MKKTKTSSFGSGKRESHDSSEFYGRGLYAEGLSNGIFTENSAHAKSSSVFVAPEEDWADRFYCQSSEAMYQIPDNSVGLAFTSPPYNVGKDYEGDLGLQAYLGLIESVAREVYRVLRPGARYVVNVANLGRKPYIPMHAYFYDRHLRVGFLPMGEIIWQKGEGATGNVAWGSWLSAKAPRLRDVHEYLLVFAKDMYSRPDDGLSSIRRAAFMDSTLSIWRIPPESAQRVGHPAPFPVELAERVIDLYSYVGDVVLDPFVGSGSTAVAAVAKKRHYVGFDVSQEYCSKAAFRVKNEGKLYMPTEKTETSELAIAFGLLGIENPLSLGDLQLARAFEGTLTIEKYSRFKEEFQNPTNAKLYSLLMQVGSGLRTSYDLFRNTRTLRWNGPERQARTTSGAQDLLVANTAISVKADSDVVSNPSPSNIFEHIPQGRVPAERSENWYLMTDPDGFQQLYDSVRRVRLFQFPQFPDSVAEFEENARKRDRAELQSEIRKLSKDQRATFDQKYVDMCRTVAIKSAGTFNDNYRKSMETASRNAIIEHVVKFLFRLDSIEYILAGTSGRAGFAVKLPSLKEWKHNWEILEIRAAPDLAKKQSRARILVSYRNKTSKVVSSAQFHVEIRWSHGKFCGAPEAKLYKDFAWSSIPFVTDLFGTTPPANPKKV